jgi:hypothetical protein
VAYVLLGKEGNSKFTLSAFFTEWDNPFRVRLTQFNQATLQPVSANVTVTGDTPASPLVEGKYDISRRWSVGFWYNPIRGEKIKKTVHPSSFDVPFSINLDRDTDLADFHVIYYGPKGLTGQLGYYHEHGDVTNNDTNGPHGSSYTLVSWNAWVTKGFDFKAKGKVISPFISTGYHPSSGLNHATSILLGTAATLNERISLSTSLWFFDLSHTATRFTAGVVVQL